MRPVNWWKVGFAFAVLFTIVSIDNRLGEIAKQLGSLRTPAAAVAVDFSPRTANSVVASMNYVWDDEKQVWDRMRQPEE